MGKGPALASAGPYIRKAKVSSETNPLTLSCFVGQSETVAQLLENWETRLSQSA